MKNLNIDIPTSMNDCNKILDKLLTDDQKAEIMSKSKQEFLINSHFGLGQWLRNNWKLWEQNLLTVELCSIGVLYPDDMSGKILEMYYDYLKNCADIE